MVNLIPLDVLFGNPERSDPSISPDGKLLAYLAPNNGVLNVWVRTLGKQDDRTLTFEVSRGVLFYSWAFDGRNLVYLRDKAGDENWHLIAVDITTGLTRDLTPFEGVQAHVIASTPDLPDEFLVGLNKRDLRYFDAYRLKLSTGELREEARNPGDVACWIADQRLKVRAAYVSDSKGGFIIRVEPQDDHVASREAVHWGPEDAIGSRPVGFGPDGKGLYLLDSVGANTVRLVELLLDTGERRVLAEDPIYDVTGLLRHPRTGVVQAVAITKDRVAWHALAVGVAEDLELIRRLHPGDPSFIGSDLSDRIWIVGFDDADGPISYFVYNRADKRAVFLFSQNCALESARLASMESVQFKSRDGLDIHGYLTVPQGIESKALPLVLNVHGGPWSRDVWGFHPEAQWLANRGYACLQVNFRGSTGYGKQFLNAGYREWGGKMQDDLIDAVSWAVDQGIADASRVAIFGASYGGYAALAGAAFTPNVFACAVDVVGPSNLVTMMENIPPYWEVWREIEKVCVGDVETERAFLEMRSPFFSVDRIRIPMLIGQGANDPRVPRRESDQIVEALRHRGVAVEYVVFEDEGHGFYRPENRIPFYRVAEQFLAAHLKASP